MTHRGVSILVVAIGTFIPGVVGAANYFSWGVESPANNAVSYGDPCNTGISGTVSKQIWLNPWMGNTTQDCAISHSGSCSMKLDIVGDDGGNQAMGPDNCNSVPLPLNLNGSSGLYYRWWMRIEPGFSWGVSDGKAKSSRVIGLLTGYVHGNGFRVSECVDPGSHFCDTPGGGVNNDYQGIDYDIASQDDGQWHEYIMFIRPSSVAGAADASFRAWVDGAEVPRSPWCSNTSMHCSSGTTGFRLYADTNAAWPEAWGGWMARPYFQLNGTASDGGTIYVDDVSTDDAYNSLLGAPDATPPAAPTGLLVR